MRKIKKSILNAIFCLYVLSSGSFLFAAKKIKVTIPEWVNTPSSVYSNDSYIFYVGSGADRKSAEIDALKGIASIFGQSIKSETKASSRMIQAKENGLVITSQVSSIDESVKKIVDVDSLIGVEIGNYWFDEVSTWYSIAVINKEKTSVIYKDMIVKNIKTENALLSKIDKNDISFDSYSLYDFAEDISMENEKLLKKLAVINSKDADSIKNKIISSKELHLKKVELAKQIPIYILVDGDIDERFEQAFQQAISTAGFRTSFDDNARYFLYAKFSFIESVSSDKKTVRCKYNGESYILDTETDQQIIPYTLSGRESQLLFSEAKDKAIKKIIKTITSDYTNVINQYLKNLVVE